MDALISDIRYAVRMLVKAPGFAAVAITTLALGIGANTAIFSVFYGVLLRPLPFPEPHRLVSLANVYQGVHDEMAVTYREYSFVAEQAPIFESLAAMTSVGMNLYSDGAAERLSVLHVSKDYFSVLGVSPELGRGFAAEEDQENGPRAVVLSHDLWRTKFGGDRDVIGRAVLLDGMPYTIVGVVPQFYQPEYDAKLWTTLAQVGRTIGSGQNLEVVGRLKRDMSLAQAQARMQPVWAAYRTAFKGMISQDYTQDIEARQAQMVRALNAPLRVLLGAIGFVLLIACANVANLTLGRAAVRVREIAVRTAIGASRGRVMQQLLTESLVLALLGGGAGLLLAEWGLSALPRLAPTSVPWEAVRLDGWALAFTFVISLAAGALFGLAPAWQTARGKLYDGLKEGSARSTAGVGRGRLRQSLVVAEVALSLVLLAGAGLLVQAFAKLIRTETGFDTDHVAAAEIWLTGSRYDSTLKITNFYRDLTTRIEHLPGVRSAAVIEAGLPLRRGGNMPTKVDTGYVMETINYRTVTPGLFATLGIPLRQGRVFTDGDDGGAENVAIVNESFARRFLRAGALDHVVVVGGRTQPTRRIVGVVGDVKSEITQRILPTVFLPSAQTSVGLTRAFSSWFPIHILARTAGDPGPVAAQLRRVIHEADPQVPVGRARTMNEVLSASLALQRFLMALLGGFAALALTLAAVGLYGVISSLVTQRTHEIGVRMALGAEAKDVLRLVLGQGMLLCAVGVLLGLGASAALTRLLINQLYGINPVDPATFAAVTALLVVIGLGACLVPARRATKVDPMVALRDE
jgi:predicted permease